MQNKLYGVNPIESFEERAAIFETGREGYRRGRRGIAKAYFAWAMIGIVIGAMGMGWYMATHPFVNREIRCTNRVEELTAKVSSLVKERDGLISMVAGKRGVDIALNKQ